MNDQKVHKRTDFCIRFYPQLARFNLTDKLKR